MKEAKKNKSEIENRLNEMDLTMAERLIFEYEKICPTDMEILNYKTILYLAQGNTIEALGYALLGVRKYPMNGDMYYNLACIYEQEGDILSAYKNFFKALYIYKYNNDEKYELLCLNEKTEYLFECILKKTNELLDKTTRTITENKFLIDADGINERLNTIFGLYDITFRSNTQAVGKYYWVNDFEKKYMALYKVKHARWVGADNFDLIHVKGELLTVKEGQYYTVKGDAKEYLLPIATTQEDTIHNFEENSNKYQILQRSDKIFNYYRVKQGTSIESSGKSYYGNPIPLGHKENRKKLVLNLFVDGLSQEILNGEDFKRYMPYTYAFFSKGIICTRAYSSAEWTYPSMANFITGLDTVNHMMFHDNIDGVLPEDIPTLAEYFQKAGYYTDEITCDWRSTPNFGYGRGYEGFIYQNPLLGYYRAEGIVADAIERIECFQDTDHFLWLGIGDLHDIADGFDTPISTQSVLQLKNRVKEDKGITSVKQAASENKISVYKQLATYLDLVLNNLYTYLQNKYMENEVIVSLFADHGQGYLIPEGKRFLSKERVKVAFMFRGGLIPQVTDEIISTSDYISIMCHLAGISIKKDIIPMSKLPMCFGGKYEREYALSESIHPKDPYCATLFTKEYTVYFENSTPTGEDGRFELKKYTLFIEDEAGEEIRDPELYEKYLNIIMEHIAPLIIY